MNKKTKNKKFLNMNVKKFIKWLNKHLNKPIKKTRYIINYKIINNVFSYELFDSTDDSTKKTPYFVSKEFIFWNTKIIRYSILNDILDIVKKLEEENSVKI